MSAAESPIPTHDASESTGQNPQFSEDRFVLYSINGVTEATTPPDGEVEASSSPDDPEERQVVEEGAPMTTVEEKTTLEGEEDLTPETASATDTSTNTDRSLAPESEGGSTAARPDLIDKKIGRRGFLFGAGALGLGLVGAATWFGTRSGDTVPSPQPNNPKPSEGTSASATAQPTETASTEPTNGEQETSNEFGLPTPAEFAAKTPAERLKFLREALPESLLSEPETVFRKYWALRELIINTAADDTLYNDYNDNGGLNFKGYVWDTVFVPLLTELEGVAPSTDDNHGGIMTVAERIAVVQLARLNDKLPNFKPYHYTITVDSVGQPTRSSAPYDLPGTILDSDSIDAEQAKLLKQHEDFVTNAMDTPTPVNVLMVSLHYNRTAKIIQPVKVLAQ